MKINLKKIGQYFTLKNLWHKTFNDFSQEEIEGLCEVVLSGSSMSGKIISQCYVCGSTKFWRFNGDNTAKWICMECHPPATNTKKEYLQLNVSDEVIIND